ncbi:eif-1a [Anaeramoeba ignava]|uniref:Eukaryotic translation initiation factor 4C n=1 Tax=Anaeramoeba ignava TaxID=1746090 RepID=A0A9Q0LDH1_ANAIG|nr:eif-1a [Anaeramoeba ignava]|eukprot:Anaeramoba_ignava/a97009_93.p1 GENE.a97009_93~~a97009_93.p1  ORF type:complete len:163 (-),score=60.11 a97009_93:130-576(-)
MPKNKGKGGKGRKRGKNTAWETKRPLLEKEEGQEYAFVEKILGNGRLEAYCYDGKRRLCHIRGAIRKRVWINQGDHILVTLRDFQDDKADVIHRYTTEEVRELKKMGCLPDPEEKDEDTDEKITFSRNLPSKNEVEKEKETEIDFDNI